MLILNRSQVEALLDLDALREGVAEAMVDVSRGLASIPPRIAAVVDDRNSILAAMPGYLPTKGALAAKLVSLFPGNAGSDLPTHQAVIVVFDAATGRPTALVDGTEITASRTAAGSALSADLLAVADADVLAILGTGVQARSHALAVTRVRRFTEVRIAGRDRAKAETLAGELSSTLDATLITTTDFAEACRGAHVVCATTDAAEPVVHREHIAPGTHITSVGYNVAGREIDAQTVVDALVVVESRQAVLAPPPTGSNDLRMPIDDRLIGPDHVHAEIGELVDGTRPGRSSPEQITLYKSVGIAAQDVAAAALVVEAAAKEGVGMEVEF